MTLTSEYQFIGRSNALTSASGYNYYILVYAKTAPDLTAGAHTVSVKMRLVCSADVYFYDWATSGYAKVGDVTAFEWSVQLNPNREWDTYLTEGGVTYPRWIDLNEGTALIGVGFGASTDVALEASWAHVYGTDLGWMPPSGKYATLNTTVTLPVIEGPTVPVVAASSVELGKSLTIQTTALLDGCTHTLSYSIGNATGVIAENVGASCTWKPLLSLAYQIPNATSGTAVITCTTYRDGNQFGTPQQTTVLLIVPDTVVPTASATWEDASGALGALGVYANGVSRLAVDVAGTGAYGSTITGASMTLGGKAYTGGVITSTGALALVVTVKDSRGRTGSKSYPINVVDYAAPTLTLAASRWSTADASGTADDMGEYAKITVTGYVAPTGSNTASLSIAYGTSSKAVSLTTGNVNYSMIVSAPSAATLPISATLSDKLFSSVASMTLSIGYATVDFLKGGRGIAFGTTATKEGFTCHMDTDFGGYAVTGLPTPAADDAAATKGYVDTGLAKRLPLSGGTMTGAIAMGGNKITGLGTPTAGTDAATKAYVDGKTNKSTTIAVSANTAVALAIAEGEILQLSYVASTLTAADVNLKVNGSAPTAGWYYTPSAGNFTGGQIARAGATHYAFFHGFIRVMGGKVYVWGQDFRGGDGAGMGQSAAYWNGISAVTSLTFTQPGTISYMKL